MSKFDTRIVDINRSACDGDAKYNVRYTLTIYKQVSQQSLGTAIVILKNPASTCKDNIFFSTNLNQIYDVDKTTTHVVNTLFSKNLPYEKIVICNLFPYYDNIPSTINSVYGTSNNNHNVSYTVNLSKIESEIRQNIGADVFCAWGQSSGIDIKIYDKAIQDVVAILMANGITTYYTFDNGNLLCNQLPKTQFYPIHGSKW